jgi:hypothetical protein
MAHAKLSHSAAASLAFVKKLQNDETHAMVRKEVFAQAKAAFGIPDKHKVKVELDPANPNYLDIRRKTDNSLYELNSNGKWTGAEAEPAPAETKAVLKMTADQVKEAAVEAFDMGDAVKVPLTSMAGTSEDVITKDGFLYVRVDASDVVED